MRKRDDVRKDATVRVGYAWAYSKLVVRCVVDTTLPPLITPALKIALEKA